MGKSGKKKKKLTLDDKLLRIFQSKPRKRYVVHQLASKTNAEEIKVYNSLDRLIKQKKVIKYPGGKFKLYRESSKASVNHVEGVLELTRKGTGFVISNNFKEDIFIRKDGLGHALHGDKVEVQILGWKRGGRPQGKIVSVVQRFRTSFVVVLEVNKGFAFGVPIARNMLVDFFIPKTELADGKTGDRAIVELVDWPSNVKNPIGRVTKIFTDEDMNEVEMQSILIENGFDIEFPIHVEEAAEKIDTTITKEEIAERRDMRGIETFTIDPEDAKDFDDAISWERLDSGKIGVGIHIADVSHYIKPGSAIDQEAYKRATSVYLADRVAPMLPEVLSNGVCSLRPNEDKLCYSVVFTIDNDLEILDTWMGRTVIHSDKRFTYDEAQQVIETGKGPHKEAMLWLNRFAHDLRKKRIRKGSIQFESDEVLFRLDDTGTPLEVIAKLRQDAHKMIEDLMLLANRSVAELFTKTKGDFVYRIHDLPDMDKLLNFKELARSFDYQMDLSNGKAIARSLNKLLDTVEDKPEKYILVQLAIRSMAKAVYSTDNIGHYGLAFSDYTHFTSPIRRYPDVLVHRGLTSILKKTQWNSAKLEQDCEHCSQRERDAAKAERESVKLKQVEFMQTRVGKEYEGVISGISTRGFWVELLDNYCEGFVPLETLEPDLYIYEEEKYRLVGEHTGTIYHFGDLVRVEVVSTDLVRREIEFELIEFDQETK